MRLRRVRVAGFRGLTLGPLPQDPKEVLSERIVLIHGPNEAGKSRLFEALRAVLLEPAKKGGAIREGWFAYGDRIAPRIELELELGPAGAVYRVDKRFIDKPSTRLEGEGKRWDGPEAEARLRTLLGLDDGGGATARGKGKGKGKGSGTQGQLALLWVPQAAHSQPIDLEEDPEAGGIVTRLQDAVHRTVEAVSAGPLAHAVHDAALGLYHRAYKRGTTKNPQPIDQLQRAVADHAEARARWQAAHQAVEQRAHQLDELARLRTQREQLLPRMERCRQDLRDAEARAVRVGELRQARAALERPLAEARQRHADARAAIDARTQAAAHLAAHEAAAAAAGERASAVAREHAQASEAHERAAEQELEARRAMEASDRAVAHVRAARERTELAQRVQALRERLGRAEVAEAHAQALTAQLAADPWTREVFEGVRAQSDQLERARARLQGAAARVELHAARTLVRDGQPLAAGERWSAAIVEPTALQLRDASGEIATVTILPGAEGITALRAAEVEAAAALDQALRERFARDMEHAAQLRSVRVAAEAEQQRAQVTARAEAPEGIDALRRELAVLERRLAALTAQLELPHAESIPANAEDARDAEAVRGAVEAGHAEGFEALLAAAVERHTAAKRAHAAANDAATHRGHTLTEVKVLAGRAEEQLRASRDQAHASREALARWGSPEELAVAASAAQGERDALERQAEALERQLAVLGAEALDSELQRARDSLKAVEQEQQGNDRRLQRLELELLGASASDSAPEQLAAAQRALQGAAARVRQLQLEAQAAKRVQELLAAEIERNAAIVVEPVRARTRRYLELLWPGTDVALGESFTVAGRRPAHAGSLMREPESFESLSQGARDQLSLIVRIAMAELIAEAFGERVPLVLDDPLVHADAERMRAMARVLHLASERLQVIVFTCDRPAYDALGPNQVFELPLAVEHAAGSTAAP